MNANTTAAQAHDDAEIEKAFRDVLTTASGKRVIYWILEQCSIYRDAYCGDNNATNYVLGQQASGRRVIAKMDQIDPRLYPSLLTDVADIKELDRMAASMAEDNEENDDAED
jgi:hypothetical protein